jgi:flagellar biosynthesis protein
MTANQDPSSPFGPLFHKDKPSVAVAIKADEKDSHAPAQIVASGRGALAEQILALAFAEGLPVREDADLATLLATLELDTPIPSEAIIAVAEILAKVYEANGKSENIPSSTSVPDAKAPL